ncbi:uncharacterized protein, partial [Clytia hemisphaerica]
MAYALFKYTRKNGEPHECIAPTDWIRDRTLYWPKYGAAQKSRDNAPLDENWPSYTIQEIKKHHDNYEYLNECCYSTTENDSPVKKKQNQNYETKRSKSPQFSVVSSVRHPAVDNQSSPAESSPVQRRNTNTVVRSSYSPITNNHYTEQNANAFLLSSAMKTNADLGFDPNDCMAPDDLLNQSLPGGS